ncbi:fatty acid desaturase family protein [Enhygromyxa salina]|uniref:Fatty acid desaturase n=1 Tax=Enhygromyxa salina TaxID=215803 RepID=A0A2S9YIG2_9BACT|nr:fatty acid desaturase family protein [Enhygromyxa salina]PRQ04842.1 Fatty acid desaturase [Enhygromyxa salina]
MTTRARPRGVTDFLTAAEIRELTERSDARGFMAVATSWGMIAASFALVGLHPRWWTIVIALIVIGGRQLGLSILMHDAAHRSLFRTRRLNLVIGQWLCAAPGWTSLARYRAHHLRHHAHTNEPDDPDLALVAPFPISRASLARKFARDLSGLTGLKRVVALLAMDFGVLEYTASVTITRIDQRGRSVVDVARCGLRNFGPVLLTNVALGLLLRAAGHGELYMLWVGAYLTSFSLFLRIRAMAEHACTQPPAESGPAPRATVFFNTRTTQANLIARLTVAPHAVNYHLEHHLLPTVPLYSVSRMHRLLRERGALAGCHVSSSYRAMLRTVTTAH